MKWRVGCSQCTPAESGLYYLQSRFYDPLVGRFINADTTDVLTATMDDVTDKNLFTYCDNNPIMREDHGGDRWSWGKIFAGVAIVAAVVAVGALVVATAGAAAPALAVVGGGVFWGGGFSAGAIATVTTIAYVSGATAVYSAAIGRIYYYSEHSSTKNGKKANKHQKGNARRDRDQRGEKKKQNPKWKKPKSRRPR